MSREVQHFGSMGITGIGRAWSEVKSLAITAAETTTPSVDFRTFAGGSVQVPVGSGLTLLTFYADHSNSGVFGALYSSDNVAIAVTVAAGRTVDLPSALFGCPYFKMVGNTTGTVTLVLKG